MPGFTGVIEPLVVGCRSGENSVRWVWNPAWEGDSVVRLVQRPVGVHRTGGPSTKPYCQTVVLSYL